MLLLYVSSSLLKVMNVNGRSSISMPTSLVSHIFSYIYTDVHLAMFRGETEKAETYWKKLSGTIKHNEAGNELCCTQNNYTCSLSLSLSLFLFHFLFLLTGFPVVPKLFYYSEVVLRRKSSSPSSSYSSLSSMVALEESFPFLWSQSLFFIARLLS